MGGSLITCRAYRLCGLWSCHWRNGDLEQTYDLKDSMNPPFEIPDFKGSYVPLRLVSGQSEVRKDHNERMAGGISIIGGSLPISLENVSVLKKSVDPQLKQNYSIGIGVNHCWIYNWTCQFAICYVCA